MASNSVPEVIVISDDDEPRPARPSFSLQPTTPKRPRLSVSPPPAADDDDDVVIVSHVVQSPRSKKRKLVIEGNADNDGDVVDSAHDRSDDKKVTVIQPSTPNNASTTKDGDDELTYVGSTTGVRALVDFVHNRFHCGVYPFDKKNLRKYCAKCFCYVCDVACSECQSWSDHAGASNAHPKWRKMRNNAQRMRKTGEHVANKQVDRLPRGPGRFFVPVPRRSPPATLRIPRRTGVPATRRSFPPRPTSAREADATMREFSDSIRDLPQPNDAPSSFQDSVRAIIGNQERLISTVQNILPPFAPYTPARATPMRPNRIEDLMQPLLNTVEPSPSSEQTDLARHSITTTITSRSSQQPVPPFPLPSLAQISSGANHAPLLGVERIVPRSPRDSSSGQDPNDLQEWRELDANIIAPVQQILPSDAMQHSQAPLGGAPVSQEQLINDFAQTHPQAASAQPIQTSPVNTQTELQPTISSDQASLLNISQAQGEPIQASQPMRGVSHSQQVNSTKPEPHPSMEDWEQLRNSRRELPLLPPVAELQPQQPALVSSHQLMVPCPIAPINLPTIDIPSALVTRQSRQNTNREVSMAMLRREPRALSDSTQSGQSGSAEERMRERAHATIMEPLMGFGSMGLNSGGRSPLAMDELSDALDPESYSGPPGGTRGVRRTSGQPFIQGPNAASRPSNIE